MSSSRLHVCKRRRATNARRPCGTSLPCERSTREATQVSKQSAIRLRRNEIDIGDFIETNLSPFSALGLGVFCRPIPTRCSRLPAPICHVVRCSARDLVRTQHAVRRALAVESQARKARRERRYGRKMRPGARVALGCPGRRTTGPCGEAAPAPAMQPRALRPGQVTSSPLLHVRRGPAPSSGVANGLWCAGCTVVICGCIVRLQHAGESDVNRDGVVVRRGSGLGHWSGHGIAPNHRQARHTTGFPRCCRLRDDHAAPARCRCPSAT